MILVFFELLSFVPICAKAMNGSIARESIIVSLFIPVVYECLLLLLCTNNIAAGVLFRFMGARAVYRIIEPVYGVNELESLPIN
jgi:hypothetical protein